MTRNLEVIKYGLGLHTTTPELGLAIANMSGESRFQVWDLQRELSSKIHQYLIDFILPQSWADLALIAVAKGPGGFTGTRIGVVIARTLGQQLEIPVFAISTLAALVWSQKGNNQGEVNLNNSVFAVQMRAQRSQIFGGVYQFTSDASGITALLPDTVFTAEIWQETLANLHRSYQLIEAESSLAATVTSVLELAYLDWQQGKRPDWSEALPYYGQHPVDM